MPVDRRELGNELWIEVANGAIVVEVAVELTTISYVLKLISGEIKVVLVPRSYIEMDSREEVNFTPSSADP